MLPRLLGAKVYAAAVNVIATEQLDGPTALEAARGLGGRADHTTGVMLDPRR